MILFFTIPVGVVIGVVMLALCGLGILCQVIMFISEYRIYIALFLILLFAFVLSKIKNTAERRDMLALGIGMIPLFVYIGHTLPWLAELALEGSLLRFIFNLIAWPIELGLFLILGWIPGLIGDKIGWEGSIKKVVCTGIWCAIVVFGYLFTNS